MSELSVLLPVGPRCDPPDLTRSVESVCNQTRKPDEVIILTDKQLTSVVEKTIQNLCDEISIVSRLIVTTTSGLGPILQTGLEECSGNLVARMDADDIAIADRFQQQCEFLEGGDFDIIGSAVAEFVDNPTEVITTRQTPETHREIVEQMGWRNPINHPSVMFRRDPILEAGGYRKFSLMEDWDLWARCVARGLRFHNIPEPLVKMNVDDLTYRRGGLEYVRSELQMAHHLRRIGIASPADTVRHLTVRVPVRLLPASLLKRVYRFVRARGL